MHTTVKSVPHRYDAGHGGTRQPPHRDGSLLSCNVALSAPSDFEGGGTHFEALGGAPLQLEQGRAMCHASGIRHSGHPITSGQRWVLVIFVNARQAVMHARRCCDRGITLRQEGRLFEALEEFAAAAEAAPEDHETRLGLGRLFASMGELEAARASLTMAISLYSHCPFAHIELGALLVQGGRPRAALRQYERAIHLCSDPKLDAGLVASVGVSRCRGLLAARGARTRYGLTTCE